MNLYGLIGFPLTHSFSKKYFSDKFQKENIVDSKYELFEIKEVSQMLEIVKEHADLKGLNVTIPYKESVLPFLHEIDPSAMQIGAVNVIKINNGRLKGFNSDYYGFRQSLMNFIGDTKNKKALLLGTGGASKAVSATLHDLEISCNFVSRKGGQNIFSYEELDENIISAYQLIINTTPLGMYPKTETFPEIPYQYLSPEHFLFDLIYNPEETTFMKKGKEKGAKVKNGLEMLHLQAEKAWEIWNS
ncbi:MAG TPA: shikimate dehydrogenase [Cytophagaceae bacterium]|jgi:shikimate dehydrogenase|nr:shikimate dehydrogenase [Cytophagaceae bacterium]